MVQGYMVAEAYPSLIGWETGPLHQKKSHLALLLNQKDIEI